MMNRIIQMFGLAKVTLVDDSQSTQILQVDEGPIGQSGDRIVDKLQAVGQFGFASNPPRGAIALLARFGGLRSIMLAIGSIHLASRLKNLGEGDVAVYDVRGTKIWLSSTGIVVDGAGLPMTIQNVGTLTLNGEMHVTGDIKFGPNQTSLIAFLNAYDGHKHTGIQRGGASSDGPDQTP